jgi:predicted ATPase
MGAKLWWPAYLAWLAEAYDGMGQATEGLPVLTEALTTAHNTGERFWEAELHRRKGELLLALLAEQHAEAEICFHQALAIARRQQAKSLELRAAMSLSRLWQQQGKREEAYALLAPVYGWFTEGFDTADLREAQALLATLS